MINFDEEKQTKKLDELHRKEEEDLAKILSEKYGVSYTDLSVTPINTDGLKLISESKARENNIAIFDVLDKKIKIAVISPNNEGAKKIIAELEKKPLYFVCMEIWVLVKLLLPKGLFRLLV